ncbi:MAG: hypothetical protein KAH44_01425, partial [Oricola sp.]|nr:hypothetical protein [Oricola sp.]
LVSPTGLNAGIIAPGGEDGGPALYVHSTRREKFAAQLWEEAAGMDPERAAPQPMSAILACDETGCSGDVADRAAVIAAFTSDKASLAEDCRRADIVVAFFPASPEDWRACRAFLIDRRSAWRRGAHAVWIERDGRLTVRNANEIRGDRQWTRGG